MKSSFLREIENISNLEALETLKNDYLGKTGQLNKILSWLKDLAPEDKKTVGLLANELKNLITQQITSQESVLKQAYYRSLESKDALDVTLRFSTQRGAMHPFSLVESILLPRASALWFEVKYSRDDQIQTQSTAPEFAGHFPTLPELWVTIKDTGEVGYDFFLPQPHANIENLLGFIDGLLCAFFPKGIDTQFRPYWTPEISGAQKIFLNQNQIQREIGILWFREHQGDLIAYVQLDAVALWQCVLHIQESSHFFSNQPSWLEQFR